MSVKIPLTNGYVAIVDSADEALVRPYKWHVQISRGGKPYACRTINSPGGKTTRVRMHRVICSCPAGSVIDHKNGNTLDNRRENLRAVTHSENMRNVPSALPGSATGVRGVEFDKQRNRFRATIRIAGKHKAFGFFKTVEEAHLLRLKLELEHYGVQPRRRAEFVAAGLI